MAALATGPGCPFDLVVMCGSQGSLGAFKAVLSRLPVEFPAPILLADHRAHGNADHMTGLLARATALSVIPAEDGSVAAAGTVIVSPAGSHPTVDADLVLRMSRSAGQPRRDGDALLASAARSFGSRLIAVVLTGRLEDGASGVRAVKRAGGRVLVQHPGTAEHPGMPSAALATGCVDFALPLPHLAFALVSMVMAPGAAELLRVDLPVWADLAANRVTTFATG